MKKEKHNYLQIDKILDVNVEGTTTTLTVSTDVEVGPDSEIISQGEIYKMEIDTFELIQNFNTSWQIKTAQHLKVWIHQLLK